jgi:hypothetical protein
VHSPHPPTAQHAGAAKIRARGAAFRSGRVARAGMMGADVAAEELR